MADRIQLRRDTEADWTSNDPTLASGEVGVVTDTDELVVGDGSTAFTSLPRFGPAKPTGEIAYAQVTVGSASITTTETDIVSTSVTIPAGRKILVTAICHWASSDGATYLTQKLYVGGTVYQTSGFLGPTEAVDPHAPLTQVARVTGVSGTVTVKFTGVRTSGTGSVITEASATQPAFVLVEDIGEA